MQHIVSPSPTFEGERVPDKPQVTATVFLTQVFGVHLDISGLIIASQGLLYASQKRFLARSPAKETVSTTD